MRGGVVNHTFLGKANKITSTMGRMAEQAVAKVCDSVGEVVTETINNLISRENDEKEESASTTAQSITMSVTR